MKLQVVLETLQSPVFIFTSEIKQLVSHINDLAVTYEKQMIDNDPKLWNRYYKQRLTTWFSSHWPNILSSARSIQNQSRKPLAGFTDIANTPIFAYTSDSSPFTKGDGFKNVDANIGSALRSIKQDQLAQDYKNAWSRLLTAVENGKQQPEVKTKIKQPKDSVQGQQYAQVEMVINSVLSSLSDEDKHKARTMLSKSANKLQDLQVFMDNLK